MTTFLRAIKFTERRTHPSRVCSHRHPCRGQTSCTHVLDAAAQDRPGQRAWLRAVAQLRNCAAQGGSHGELLGHGL